MKEKISIVLLTYKRRENCQKIINQYETYALVDEILVASNDGFIPKSTNGKTRTVVFNNKHSLYARYYLALESTNEFIFLSDDDFLISENELKKMFLCAIAEPEKIHGYFGRDLFFNLFYGKFIDGEDRYVDIVLPGFSIVTRKMCQRFVPFINSKMISFLKRINLFLGFNQGNGEDILFALLSKKENNQKHKTHNVSFSFLDNETGSISKQGILFRFCRNMSVWIGLFLQRNFFFFIKNKV